MLAPAGNAGDVVGMPQKPAMEYKVEGGRAGRFIIRSCFGGNHANFIASGSEVGGQPCMCCLDGQKPLWPCSHLDALHDACSILTAVPGSVVTRTCALRTAGCTSGIELPGTCWPG